MNKAINILKWISVIGGAIAGLFGAWDDALTYLLVLNAVDFASGLVCAFRGKSHKTESGGVSSSVVFDGVARKAFMWLIVLLAAALDRSIGDGFFLYRERGALDPRKRGASRSPCSGVHPQNA